MLKINQRVSGLRFTSLGSGGTNGETKRPCRFSVHTPLSCWKWNQTYEKSASVTILALMNVMCGFVCLCLCIKRLRYYLKFKKVQNTERAYVLEAAILPAEYRMLFPFCNLQALL